MEQIVMLPVKDIFPHPENPRQELGDLHELVDSIKAKGILQNLTVVEGTFVDKRKNLWLDSGYTVIIGHRRLAAAKLAGLEKVPCAIATMTHQEQVETMLMENMQRSDLTLQEQARGFQMLLDFGDNVYDVAVKTGFSASTIRRRVKLMELDQKKLAQVIQERQITLEDFDKLGKIEDVKERNKCLKKIGTNDFEMSVSRAYREQVIRKNREKALEWLALCQATEKEGYSRWNESYTSLLRQDCFYMDLSEVWEKELEKVDLEKMEKVKSGAMHYQISGSMLYVFADAETVKQETEPEKSPEEKAEEEKIRREWEHFEETGKIMYGLRKDFVEKLKVTGRNEMQVLKGVVMLLVGYGGTPASDKIHEFLGVGKCFDMEAVRAFVDLPKEKLALFVYLYFSDSDRLPTIRNYWEKDKNHPRYMESKRLNILYDWLLNLGYKLSATEAAVLNGTDEHYAKVEQEEGQ